MNDKNFNPIAFEMPKNQFNAIKVIGVGGGGSNAVNYMFQQDIKGVDFVICNTDSQALENSPIPTKIQMGVDLTEGMGAGANPEIGAKAAQESYNELREVLESNTKMVFITAGMGGGTGTGAAPVIAKIAKELSLLTVGIVTIPFDFEGKSRIKQAQKGIAKLREFVDALIVINNDKLSEVYGNLGYKSGFAKADEVLSTAAKGIAEVITHHYKQNIDLNDAKTVLSNSGTAIMGSSKAKGDDRAKIAIGLVDKKKIVDVVVGPDEYRRLPELIDVAFNGDKGIGVKLSKTETYDDIIPHREDGLQAWISVMRGCDKFCTFCVVPFTRGRERSRTLVSVVDEVKQLSKRGFKRSNTSRSEC